MFGEQHRQKIPPNPPLKKGGSRSEPAVAGWDPPLRSAHEDGRTHSPMIDRRMAGSPNKHSGSWRGISCSAFGLERSLASSRVRIDGFVP